MSPLSLIALFSSLSNASPDADTLQIACAQDWGALTALRRTDLTFGLHPDQWADEALPRVLVPWNGPVTPEGRWVDERGETFLFYDVEEMLSRHNQDAWQSWRASEGLAADLRASLGMGRAGNTLAVASLLLAPLGGAGAWSLVTEPGELQDLQADLAAQEADAADRFVHLVCAYNSGLVYVPPPPSPVVHVEDPLDFDLFGDDQIDED